jgi:hypothetical protein
MFKYWKLVRRDRSKNSHIFSKKNERILRMMIGKSKEDLRLLKIPQENIKKPGNLNGNNSNERFFHLLALDMKITFELISHIL